MSITVHGSKDRATPRPCELPHTLDTRRTRTAPFGAYQTPTWELSGPHPDNPYLLLGAEQSFDTVLGMQKVKALTAPVVAAIFVAGVLSSCASSNQGVSPQSQPDGETIVVIEEKPLPGTYMPKSVSVEAGSVVVFENNSSLPHNVVFEDPSLKDSPLMKTGESFSLNFKSSGEFFYVCTLHPVMQGVVFVS